jgi:hypothetical protein
MGAIVAAASVSVHGLYFVEYPTFTHTAFGPDAGVSIGSEGPVGTGKLASVVGSFNLWDGPVNGYLVMYSIAAVVVVAAITFLTAESKRVSTKSYLSAVIRRFGRYTSPFIVFDYLYQFRFGNVPPSVTAAFIRAAGSNTRAVLAARHLRMGVGGPPFFLLIGAVVVYGFALLSADPIEDTIKQLKQRIVDLEARSQRIERSRARALARKLLGRRGTASSQ